MIFNLPVKIYEEENCIFNHREELSHVGKKALIVTGKNSSKKNGSLSDVTHALDDQGTEYVIFDEIEENPSVETVVKASELAKKTGVDFIIGLGGGSPIDAGKAVAVLVNHLDKGAGYLYDVEAAKKKENYLPIVAIPTTCGTGSEATAVSVLTVHEKKTKASLPHRIFPVLSLVDGKYLAYAPNHVIIATAVDALGHMIESFINSGVTDYSKMFVDTGLSIWGRSRAYLEELLDNSNKNREQQREGQRKEHYRNLMNASTLAGMAIAHDGTTIPHALSYILTYELGIAHGKAIGYFLPGYMQQASKEDREHILKMAGFKDMDDFTSFIDRSCNVGEIPRVTMERTIDSVACNQAKLLTCPYPLDRNILQKIARVDW